MPTIPPVPAVQSDQLTQGPPPPGVPAPYASTARPQSRSRDDMVTMMECFGDIETQPVGIANPPKAHHILDIVYGTKDKVAPPQTGPRAKADVAEPVPALRTHIRTRRGAAVSQTSQDAAPTNASVNASKQEAMRAVDQLITAAKGSEWKYVEGVRSALVKVALLAAKADTQTKAAAQAELANALANPEHPRPKDLALLAKVIQRVMDDANPSTTLVDIAEESLKLPNFSLRVDDEPEPSERHFTSTLLPFATAAYDYGPLGRTLLLEGARISFAGPSQAQRAQKLQEVIFALPNPPESGPPLETKADIWSALREKDIDV